MTDLTAPTGQPPPSARPRHALRADRVYLGWQYALQHPDPGPRPRRPTPPEQQQLNPGWLAAQHREENALNRPVKLAFAGALLLAAVLLAVWLAGLLTPLIAAPGIAACLLGAAMTGFAIWQSRKALHVRIAGEQRRLGKIRAEQESRLFAWQEDHARAFQDWQERRAAYERQPQWYAVSVPAGIDRVDVAGGTVSGWSALVSMVGAARLSTGGEVTVIDLSEGAVAQDLAAMSRRFGIDPLVWILPGDLPRLDLGSGLGAAALADVLSLVVNVSEDQGSTRDLAHDNAILERVLQVLGSADHEVTVGRVTAALRTLAQVGDPREDMARGLIDAAQVDAIGRLFGRGAADRVVIERAWTLESQLRKLEKLGTEPTGLPPGRLRIVATDRRAGVLGNRVLGTYVVTAFTHMLRQASADHAGGGAPAADPPQPWRHTVALAGAEKLRGDVLDRLCDACEQTRTGLVLGYRSIPAPVRERIGRGNAAVAFMRLGNAEEAKVASEQIGTEHRFVLSQLTETVGTSVTDTTGDSYTSTVGTADSVSTTASASETAGRSRGAGHSQESSMLPFGHSTRSRSRDASYSYGTSDSESITEGINTSSAWGVNTSRAAGSNESLARTSQRSREFLVEQHELQQLPPSAAIVSYAAKEGRRVVLADTNPGILALPTATVLGLDEARRSPELAVARPDGPGGQAGIDVTAPSGPDAAYPQAPAPAASSPGLSGAWSPAAAQAWPAAEDGSAEAADDVPAEAADFWPADRPWPGPTAGSRQGEPPPLQEPDRETRRRRKAHMPLSWRGKDQPPPNLGPPPERLDWRKRRD